MIEYTVKVDWYVNGKLHRTDGPAVECDDGAKSWYVNGVEFTQAEVKTLVNQLTVHRGILVAG
jgi:hypothetical protein